MPCLVLICWKFFVEVWSGIGFHHLLHALLEVLLFEELWNLSLFEITDISSLLYLIHWIVCLPLWIIYQFFFMLALLWNSWLVMKLLATKWKIHLHKLNYTTNFVLWVVWLMTISVFFFFHFVKKGTKLRIADFVHGADGLGNQNFPPPAGKPIEQLAAAFLVEQAKLYPGKVTVVALGPLTNIALVRDLIIWHGFWM